MATLQLYDQLLQFPLFQGMSRDDLARVAGHTKFGFLKFANGQTMYGTLFPAFRTGEGRDSF